ncbi:hypothetical protein KUTeg_017239 [Tegillarca granosa]|uniref:Fibrinogen C-terminal domain-containing protein n=1 Tax=Tegillarca granosa TaxID=220873 RepID=A0ABQ9EIW0_TEGGR|nr:hypothetical protein KUTeg_017238 [Tegillarca granosa]KAJ8305209.1 hypothetical protein KUTeg_017239 [Tegillarca granosa]
MAIKDNHVITINSVQENTGIDTTVMSRCNERYPHAYVTKSDRFGGRPTIVYSRPWHNRISESSLRTTDPFLSINRFGKSRFLYQGDDQVNDPLYDYINHKSDSLGTYHKGHEFKTKDKYGKDKCPILYIGAWWYNSCHYSNLNGKYGDNNYGKGLDWHSWKGYYESLKRTEMKIRRE